MLESLSFVDGSGKDTVIGAKWLIHTLLDKDGYGFALMSGDDAIARILLSQVNLDSDRYRRRPELVKRGLWEGRDW